MTYTERDLFALDDRIRRDADQEDGFLDGYGRAGFFYVRSEVDIPDGVVRLEIAATRSDAAAYFAARYGPLVRTELVGDRYECADPFAYAGPRTVGALGGR